MNKKSFKVQDHVGIFDNYFSDEICDKYRNYFDKVTSIDRNIINKIQDKHYSLLAGWNLENKLL